MGKFAIPAIRSLVRTRVGSVTKKAGFEEVSSLVWVRDQEELLAIVTSSFAKGLHTVRRFDINWGFADPGLIPLTYGRQSDVHSLSSLVVGSTSRHLPELLADWLELDIEAGPEAFAELNAKVERHAEITVGFLGRFTTRAQLRAFFWKPWTTTIRG